MSSVPPPYTPQSNYQTIAAANPGNYIPGSQLDTDYGAISDFTSQVLARLALIQRDDGNVANIAIDFDQLTPAVKAAINDVGILFVGTYLSANLPDPTATAAGTVACVTDLEGGIALLLCNGTNWRRLNNDATNRDTVSVSGAITLTPLLKAPVQIFAGSLTGNLSIGLTSTNGAGLATVFKVIDQTTRNTHTFTVNGKILSAGQWIEFTLIPNVGWVQTAGGTLL